MPWFPLAHGNYNSVYSNSEEDDKKTLVFKVQHVEHILESLRDADSPERSIRLWNLINPDLHPPAELHENPELGRGWVCPYVQGVQASDDEILAALLQIFNRTGRIVIDAISDKNFLRTPSGQIVCIDIGMAVELERREKKPSKTLKRSREEMPPHVLTRQKSEMSLTLWNELELDFDEYFSCDYAKENYPKTAQVIQALLFIKIKRPDISNVDFLDGNLELIANLENAYSILALPDSSKNRLAIRNSLQALDNASKTSTLRSTPTDKRVRARVDLGAAGASTNAGAGAGASAPAPAPDKEKEGDLPVAKPKKPSHQRFHFFSPPLRDPRSFLQPPTPTPTPTHGLP
jgi:hypothetical protein